MLKRKSQKASHQRTALSGIFQAPKNLSSYSYPKCVKALGRFQMSIPKYCYHCYYFLFAAEVKRKACGSVINRHRITSKPCHGLLLLRAWQDRLIRFRPLCTSCQSLATQADEALSLISHSYLVTWAPVIISPLDYLATPHDNMVQTM